MILFFLSHYIPGADPLYQKIPLSPVPSAGAMLKKISCSVTTLLLMFLLFCSRFDETTGLGKDIIRDIDPSLTEVNPNFRSFNSLPVTSAFSTPDQNDSLFGIHRSVISVGNKDNVSASGFVEFKFNSEILNAFKTKATDNTSLEIDSITLQFSNFKNTDKNSSLPVKLDLFACTDGDSTSRAPSSRQLPLASVYLNGDSTQYIGSTSNQLIRDSVENIVLSIKETIKACNSDTCVKPVYLRFYLFNDEPGSLAHLSASATLKFYLRIGSDSIIANLKSNYTNFVAMDQNIDSLSKIPVSSFATQRTAVFKLDISSLQDTLASLKTFRILSAGFSIAPKSYKGFTNDTATQVRILYHLSDTLFDNNKVFLSGRVLRQMEMTVTVDTTQAPTDTFFLRNLEDILQKFSTGSQKTAYLYIQLSGKDDYTWKEITWNNPEFKATLTTKE